MSLAARRVARHLLASALSVGLTAAVASAQTPTLTASSDLVVPGASVTLAVMGTPGEHFAIVGSVVGAGASYGGLTLAVGEDFAVLAVGQLDGMGRATVPFVPPFLGSVLDRVYLQAATSPSSSFLPAALSAGRVLRNHDLVAGLSGVAGPAGPAGAIGADGAPGAAGLPGVAGSTGPAGTPGASGATGSTGPAGGQGLQGLQGLPGVGFRTDCGGNNVAVWSVSQTAWTCSTALTDLLATVQTLTARVVALESPVDTYLDTLTLSSAVAIGTSFTIQDSYSGTGCYLSAGNYYLDVFGFDNRHGFTGGWVQIYGAGQFSVTGTIPVSTAQVVARCRTGQPYIVAQ